ncbi:MAG: adenylate/guanylate cyclase domain-containing protein [Microvirga sp.]
MRGLRAFLRPKYIIRLRVVAVVTLACAAIGATIGLTHGYHATGIVLSGLTVAVTGLAITVTEIALQNRVPALQRMPLTSAVAIRGVIYVAIIVLVDRLFAAASDEGLSAHFDLTSALMWAVAFNFVFILRRQFGARTLLALITGRYRHPRAEEHAVLFMDLEGSTGLTERLGDLKFHALLNTVFFDVSDPVLDADGEIYRYIGDEVIVTWPHRALMRDQARRDACFECFYDIDTVLKRRGDYYRQHFGVEPRFRGALHFGRLIVGEMGQFKREIVMLGDVMNTTSRMEGVCRTENTRYVVSEPAFNVLRPTNPARWNLRDLGARALRGKIEPVRIFAVDEPGRNSVLLQAVTAPSRS